MHPQAILPRGDESGAPEVGEVTRRHRLGNAEAVVDVADADFTIDEQAQDAKAGAVGEGLEQGFERREAAVFHAPIICGLTDVVHSA